MKKLIKIQEHFYIVDDSEIKDVKSVYGQYHIEKNQIINQFPNYLTDLSECKLITHSTEDLKGVIKLNLSDVEEVVYGYNLEKMASQCSINDFDDYAYFGYINGFKAHQELVKDKFVLSKEQIEDILFTILNNKNSECCITHTKDSIVRNTIKSLLPKTEWNIEIDENNKIILIS